MTRGNVSDLVYNDFHVGAEADVTIIAGCGVHTDDEGEAAHNGIHRFYLEKGAHVLYEEKHLGTGGQRPEKNRSGDSCGAGGRCSSGDEYHSAGRRGPLDPNHRRKSRRSSEALLIHESIMTDGDEYAMTDFDVDMNGEDCAVDLISRSVAKGNSYQEYHSRIKGNNRCSGHSNATLSL